MSDLERLLSQNQKDTVLIYENPLASEEDIQDFVLEGDAKISFENRTMRMENARQAVEGQKANYVLWCSKDFPSDVAITWEFRPLREPGLCILFFSAQGRNGEDLFDSSLQKRTGEYPLYHHGDINAFHVSYFRRKEPDERAFHTCNLRKSYGFHLVTQGGDPIPDVEDCTDFYRLCVLKQGDCIRFFVNELEVFVFNDDGQTYGPLLGGGKIGFRQLAPLIAEYRNLKVYSLGNNRTESLQNTYMQLTNLIHREAGNITMQECAAQLSYHPSYLWKILKKKNTTFTYLISQEKIRRAKDLLADESLSIADIAVCLNYANSQNFNRFFTKYVGISAGEYRKSLQNK